MTAMPANPALSRVVLVAAPQPAPGIRRYKLARIRSAA